MTKPRMRGPTLAVALALTLLLPAGAAWASGAGSGGTLAGAPDPDRTQTQTQTRTEQRTRTQDHDPTVGEQPAQDRDPLRLRSETQRRENAADAVPATCSQLEARLHAALGGADDALRTRLGALLAGAPCPVVEAVLDGLSLDGTADMVMDRVADRLRDRLHDGSCDACTGPGDPDGCPAWEHDRSFDHDGTPGRAHDDAGSGPHAP